MTPQTPPVKLGLYGCGNRTRALLDSLSLDKGFQVVAAHDMRAEAMDVAVERYGGTRCDSPDKLVRHPGVEAFLISLDPFAHPEAFHRTLEAGKPIFIEKPIAMTLAEAREMQFAAERRNVPVQVGFMRRFRARHRAARAFLAENCSGTLFSVFCRWFHAGETEQINMLTNAPDNFRMKVSQIPFHCCHALDNLLLYGGDVRAVSAIGLKVIDRPYPSPDEVIASIEFANGALGCFHYSSHAFQGELTYALHAENYTLTFPQKNELVISRRPALRSQRETGDRDCRPHYLANIAPETRAYEERNVDHLILKEFLHGVRTGAPMSAPISHGVKVAELAEAIERSWREERRLTLPLENA